MSIHWSAEKELRLAKLIYEREAAGLLVDKASTGTAIRMVPGRQPAMMELCVTLPIARGIAVELYEVTGNGAEDVADLVEAVTELARGAAEIESMRSDLRAGLSELRAHLRRRITGLRAKGAIIEGRVELERIAASGASHLCPQVRLEFAGADLRVGSMAFPAEYPDDVDAVLDDIGPGAIEDSAKMRELADAGFAGRVHPLLLAVLEHRSQPVAATLAAIHSDPEPYQDIRDPDGRHLVVYWHEGTLTGTFALGEGVGFQKDSITMEGDRLAIDPKDGMTLGEALGDAQVAGAGLTISSWRQAGRNRVRVDFQAPPLPYGADGRLG